MQQKEVARTIISLQYHIFAAGALAFLLVWAMFLWLWSMPLILLEYGVGRFTRKATVESFGKLLGPGFRFMGAFQAFIGICIG